MKRVVKVIMYVYRDNNGRKGFFILHRKRNDVVTLTGHVADSEEIKEESVKDAARREIVEELGVEPISVVDLEISVEVEMKERGRDIISVEHSFLIQIPNKDVRFLEDDEKHQWHTIDELYNILTYSNQKKPLDRIKEEINKKQSKE